MELELNHAVRSFGNSLTAGGQGGTRFSHCRSSWPCLTIVSCFTSRLLWLILGICLQSINCKHSVPWYQMPRLFFCRLRLLYDMIISETLISLTHVIQVMGLQQFWTKISLRAINQTIDLYAQKEMLLNRNILTPTKQEIQWYGSENWMPELPTVDKLSQ